MPPRHDGTTVEGREITVSRSFAASRELLFRLWTDPAYVALWWGVDGATNPVCELDAQPGGAWRIEMRTPSGVVYPNGGEYLEVVANERLVYTDFPVSDSPAWKCSPPSPSVHTILFEDEKDGTRVTLTVRFTSATDRDRLAATGFQGGLEQGFARLGALVSTLAEPAPHRGGEV